jgi:hypothetical protein
VGWGGRGRCEEQELPVGAYLAWCCCCLAWSSRAGASLVDTPGSGVMVRVILHLRE